MTPNEQYRALQRGQGLTTATTTPGPSADTPKGRTGGKRAVMSSGEKAKQHEIQNREMLNLAYTAPEAPARIEAVANGMRGGHRVYLTCIPTPLLFLIALLIDTYNRLNR